MRKDRLICIDTQPDHYIHNQEKQQFDTTWEGHGLQFEIEEVLHCIENKKIESDLLSHQFSLELSSSLDEIREQIKVVYRDYE